MDTDSGRIYPPDEFEQRRTAAELRQELDEHQAHFVSQLQAGRIVPVSEEVASLVLEGKASKERKAKRKAARDARRRNRG